MIRIVKNTLYTTSVVNATLVNLQLHDVITKSDALCIKLDGELSMAEAAHNEADK